MLDGPGADAAVRLPEADLVIITGGGEYDRIAGSDVTTRLSLSYAHCHNDLKRHIIYRLNLSSLWLVLTKCDDDRHCRHCEGGR